MATQVVRICHKT